MTKPSEPTSEVALTLGEMLAGLFLLLLSFGGGFLLAVLIVLALPFVLLGLAVEQLVEHWRRTHPTVPAPELSSPAALLGRF
ncbi:MAG: hypothetical protein K6U89_06710 [Chloroflexi bacterium]|nr:hypothetical protein [Chloroflexota bacterium]